jgi:uroporphyrinogen-III synthase
MPPLVLTTRPAADAARDINWLAEKNISAISAPMLKIWPLEPRFPDPETFEAVVLTSRHAAQLLAGQRLVRLPCFCVGEATAQEAEKVGFTNITTGSGDGLGLKDAIISAGLKSLYWPSAVNAGFNIAAALADDGIAVMRQHVYKAAEVEAFPPHALDALVRGDVAVVLAHSGRAGAHFTTMMVRNGLVAQLRSMMMIAISTRAAGLCGGDWHTITVVDKPRRKAMLEAAMTAIHQLDDEA